MLALHFSKCNRPLCIFLLSIFLFLSQVPSFFSTIRDSYQLCTIYRALLSRYTFTFISSCNTVAIMCHFICLKRGLVPRRDKTPSLFSSWGTEGLDWLVLPLHVHLGTLVKLSPSGSGDRPRRDFSELPIGMPLAVPWHHTRRATGDASSTQLVFIDDLGDERADNSIIFLQRRNIS